jgi:hypothetical protein
MTDIHTLELTAYERITADDWYQEVWHLVFRCRDVLAYILAWSFRRGWMELVQLTPACSKARDPEQRHRFSAILRAG